MRRIFSGLVVGALFAGQFVVCATAAAPAEKSAAARPRIDLAFCIDTTGSMSGEIENVKAKTQELVAKLASGKPAPQIRVGLVAYRDRGDDYVTKVFPFSDDIDKVVKDIRSLQANGGGDAPEAVTEGLHASINDLSWSGDSKTLKLLFLIGDAEPNKSKLDWKTEARSAISRGIQINTLGCQGLNNGNGVAVFQEIARLADGKFENLAYRQEVAGADGKPETVIASGGSVYRVRGKSADWREGAAALSSRGALEKVDMAAVAPAESADFAGGGRALMSVTAAPKGAMRSRSVARPVPASAPAAISRTDNNLADVVLQVTKEAAAKKLKVEFK